jgi:hypothetical protein
LQGVVGTLPAARTGGGSGRQLCEKKNQEEREEEKGSRGCAETPWCSTCAQNGEMVTEVARIAAGRRRPWWGNDEFEGDWERPSTIPCRR